MDKTLVVITGPTGIGKTALAIQFAQQLGTEIISADSRQFFKELNIGVARPNVAELNAVPHHFIAFLSIHQNFSAGRFASEARGLLAQLFLKNDVVVCAGGSGLYLDAFLNGFDELPHDEDVRKMLINEWHQKGLQQLQSELKEKDPFYFEKVDKENPHRIIRALEVIRITNSPFSKLRKGEIDKVAARVVKLGLTAEREFIYDRINTRVDQMINEGLEEEARGLISYKHLNALNTVGYKEFFDYFDGVWSREVAIEKIKQHSRNYAKRQMTYWRRDSSIHSIDAQSKNLLEQAIEILNK